MYKVELTAEELSFLRLSLQMKLYMIDTSETIDTKEKEFGNELYDKLLDAKYTYVSPRKKEATKKATKVRSDKAKEKIQNAINLLQFENKAITHYSISKESGVSYNTVKKHIPDLDKIGKL